MVTGACGCTGIEAARKLQVLLHVPVDQELELLQVLGSYGLAGLAPDQLLLLAQPRGPGICWDDQARRFVKVQRAALLASLAGLKGQLLGVPSTCICMYMRVIAINMSIHVDNHTHIHMYKLMHKHIVSCDVVSPALVCSDIT